MEIINQLLTEMEEEAQTTRKMLALVPFDHAGWKPHPKSMAIDRLATHLAELPGWVSTTLITEELDFAKNPYTLSTSTSTKDLLSFFETNLEGARKQLTTAGEADLLTSWTFRNGEQIYSVRSRREVIRMVFCQIVHHRAQLGVYLRLLNIPIPGSYGPSADGM